MSYVVTYTETITHTVEIETLPEDHNELRDLVTSGEVDSIEYNATDFQVLIIEEA